MQAPLCNAKPMQLAMHTHTCKSPTHAVQRNTSGELEDLLHFSGSDKPTNGHPPGVNRRGAQVPLGLSAGLSASLPLFLTF